MVPLVGNEFFDSFSPDLAFLPILPETVSSKSLSNHDFIIESILQITRRILCFRKILQNPYWNCFYSTTEHRSAIFTTYSEILVPNTPVLKIIMSILLSISGSTGFRVVILKRLVPRERISSGGCYVFSSKKGKHRLAFSSIQTSLAEGDWLLLTTWSLWPSSWPWLKIIC